MQHKDVSIYSFFLNLKANLINGNVGTNTVRTLSQNCIDNR